MKKSLLTAYALVFALIATAQPKVFFTKEITPESLVKIYKALGVEAKGRVAVKISTGEGGNTHYLKPPFIRPLVEEVNGTIVECCTAYGGTRQDPKRHWETIHEHGFDSIFAVDLMDEFGDIRIPVKDHKHLRYDIVGEHLANYDSLPQERPISTLPVRLLTPSWHGHLNISLPDAHRTVFWSRWLLPHRPFITTSTATSSTST